MTINTLLSLFSCTQERPTDIEGIIYTGFNKSVKEKSTEIEGKLKDAKILKT